MCTRLTLTIYYHPGVLILFVFVYVHFIQLILQERPVYTRYRVLYMRIREL